MKTGTMKIKAMKIKAIKLGTIAFVIAVFCAATAVAASAQTFTYRQFNGNNGGYSVMAPVQGLNGNLYGTTALGGTNGDGTVFEMSPAGKLTTIYNFCSLANCADGRNPVTLILAANGNFYGTTTGGGANNSSICSNDGCGTVFEITPGGKLTTLYSFCSQSNCTDGAWPYAGVVQGINGNFYGTTFLGGANCIGAGGCGSVYEVTPSGKFTSLYSFCAKTNCADGNASQAPLVLATDGNFYGTTDWGGPAAYNTSSGYGTVFKISPAGQFTSFYDFCSQTNCDDGWGPEAPLIQGSDGNLYGTTSNGGAYLEGVAFKLALSGELTTLHAFCPTSCADGSTPTTPLLQATDGNFYGTTYAGGDPGNGNIFQLTPAGTVTTLYNFCVGGYPCIDGYSPMAGLTQYTDGTFYGTAADGARIRKLCNGWCGTVYSFATGLGAFVQSNPTFGKPGYTINILGNNLTGATSVTFNGTAAAFEVVSSTYIKATVPTGATTGTIVVMTPSGTLNSNAAFQVLP